MGVGYERDIVSAVASGIDMFDCVLPTRNGRNGHAFTRNGQLHLKNACFKADNSVIEEGLFLRHLHCRTQQGIPSPPYYVKGDALWHLTKHT